MTKRLIKVALCRAALMSFILPLAAQELVELLADLSRKPDGIQRRCSATTPLSAAKS